MAPTVIDIPSVATTISAVEQLKLSKKTAGDTSTYPRVPLQLSGALGHLEYTELTPILGREYKDLQIKDLLSAPNSDALLRDLAITISQRNVVFFRNQDLTTGQLKDLVQRLGELTGKPAESGLHIHPITNAEREDYGTTDNEISKISSVLGKKIYRRAEPGQNGVNRRQSAARLWHSDITFETASADYSILQIIEKPATGGDTLWASGYELYDRLSPPFQRFYETLTATYAQPGFINAAAVNGFKVYSDPRGSPLNIGDSLTSVHPVIRTNPVTGWKSVFAVGVHVSHINDVAVRESQHILDEFLRLLVENHDLQVRFKWNKNDVAIWDNRSTYHTATDDLAEEDVRIGDRAVGIAEVPYLDPKSPSRRQALGQEVPVIRTY